MPTFFLPPTVTRCASLWPCTSALGDSTRRSSAGSAKLRPSSKITVRTRLSLSTLSSVGHASAIGLSLSLRVSTQIDLALDLVFEARALAGQDHLDLKLPLAAEPFLAHHLLYGLLRGDPHLLQIFPHRHVESLLVH